MVGGYLLPFFCFSRISNVLFVWREPKRAKVSGRGLWDIYTHRLHWYTDQNAQGFQCFMLWVHFFISHAKKTCGVRVNQGPPFCRLSGKIEDVRRAITVDTTAKQTDSSKQAWDINLFLPKNTKWRRVQRLHQLGFEEFLLSVWLCGV